MQRLRTKLPPLNSLVAFEASARHLSFTRAAEELHVTQGAVSRQVRLLEEHLGIRLLHRFHRIIRLTAAGHRLQQAVTLGLEHIASAAGELRANRNLDQVTVAATLAFTSFWLIPRIPKFRAAYPNIDVRVLAIDREIDYAADGVDIAIRYGYGQWPGLEASFLLGEEIFPVCSPGYLQGRPALTSPADLLGETLLCPDEEHWKWTVWQDWLRSQGVHAAPNRHGLRLSNYPMLIQAALAGQGIALGWRYLVEDMLASGALIKPLEASMRGERAEYVVIPSDVPPSAAVLAFREWILAEAGRPSPQPLPQGERGEAAVPSGRGSG
ncbi:MAG TPA: transcriptional regulator GcvA [Candidatus Competibacteraceae bacterium]|nr:transcriptional regulator GcvA [Candidatus Competibacteraceae bacterium]